MQDYNEEQVMQRWLVSSRELCTRRYALCVVLFVYFHNITNLTPPPPIPAAGPAYPTSTTPTAGVQQPPAKKVVSLETSDVFNQVNKTGYIETTEDVDQYLSALRSKLLGLVNDNHKIRIK